MKQVIAIVTVMVVGAATFLSSGCSATLSGTKAKETDLLKNQVASLESQVGSLNQKVEEISQKQETIEIQQQSRQVARMEPNSVTYGKVLSPKKIQTALKTAGYYNGPVDGKIGAQTREAVKSFQKANGLNPDGVVGRKTASALAKVLGAESTQ